MVYGEEQWNIPCLSSWSLETSEVEENEKESVSN